MNAVKIIINELGLIKNQEAILSPIMIFTGNSNVGKSYANYLMYYFFSSFTEGNLRAFSKKNDVPKELASLFSNMSAYKNN